MNLDKRSKILLGILLFLIVVAFWPEGSSRSSSVQSDITSGTVFKTRGGKGKREVEPVKEVVTLNFSRLDPRLELTPQSRNPFEYFVERPVIIKDYEPLLEKQPIIQTKVEESPVIDSTPPGPVLPTTNHIQYIGNFGSKRIKVAVLRIDDVEHNVVQGDTFDEDFVLQTIGFESIDIGFLNFPDQPPERLAINSK